jgi:hypothetical protein
MDEATCTVCSRSIRTDDPDSAYWEVTEAGEPICDECLTESLRQAIDGETMDLKIEMTGEEAE